MENLKDLDIEVLRKKFLETKRLKDAMAKNVLENNLFKFNLYALGCEKQGKLADFHKEMCQFVDERKDRRKLILVPRGHLKSTLITIGYTLQAICKNPSVRILIANATYSMACTFLNAIKRHLERTEEIAYFWGKLAESPIKWAESEITLQTARSGATGKKEPTITAFGMTSRTSQHYDKIILDDIVNREFITSREQIEKTITFYKDCLDLLEPGGEMIILGCLTADSLVLMADGKWRKINNVRVGEEVFSYKDRKLVKREVEAVIPQGKSVVYEVKTIRHTIKATDRHPFLVIKNGKTEWVRVKNLHKGDKVVTISQVKNETSKRFYNKEFLRKNDFFLLGYLWGDGWLLKDKTRGIRGFCIAKGVNDCFLPYLEKWTKKYRESKGGYYRIENGAIGKWLYENGFDSGSKTKRIPDWIFKTRTCYKRDFIRGILEADGFRVKGKGRRIELANKRLIEDLYWLALTCGYRPTTIYHRERLICAPNSKTASLHNFYSIGLSSNYRQAFGENQFTWRWEKIKSVELVGKEDVFDLTVKDTGNFISNGYVVHNTRWHDRDLYDWILDPSNNVFQKFEIFLKRAYEGDLSDDKNFKSIFPQKYTRRVLKQLYDEKGIYDFSTQYLNDPVPEEDAVFKKYWFSYYEDDDIKGKKLNKFVMIDPAISTEKGADYTAIVTIGVDEFRNIFILNIKRERLNPYELIAEIFWTYEQWYPLEIGIEEVAFQKTLRYTINEEMQKRRIYLPMRPLKPGDRTKDQRIRGLQPLYGNKKIFHHRIHSETSFLEDELLRFPRGRFDDIIDALAYGLDLAFPPKRKVTHKRQRYLYA